MRLFELKPKALTEGQIPIHLTMVLREIVNAGRATNTVHHVVLSQLVDYLKSGNDSIRNINAYDGGQESILNAVRELKGEEQAALATWLLERLQLGELISSADTTCCGQFFNPKMGLNDWVAWVLHRQD